jgi:hypothetical protein
MPDFLKKHLKPVPSNPVSASQMDNTPPINRWSFSDWSTWQEYPYLLYARRVLKLNDPSGKAAVRGNGMHAILEYALQNNGERYDGNALLLLPDFKDSEFAWILEDMTADDIPAKGWKAVDDALASGIRYEPEVRYNLGEDWKPTDYEARWLTVIIDGLYIDHDAKKIYILDWKTGGKYVVKHTKQGSLYAAALHHQYPDYDVEFRFVYLDKPQTEDLVGRYPAGSKRLAEAVKFWDEQGRMLTTAPKSAFAPKYDVNDLEWLAPYHLNFIMNPSNYPDPDFPKPVYVV